MLLLFILLGLLNAYIGAGMVHVGFAACIDQIFHNSLPRPTDSVPLKLVAGLIIALAWPFFVKDLKRDAEKASKIILRDRTIG